MNKIDQEIWYKTKPKIHGYFACIAGDPILAAKISALLSSKECYFSVIDAPRMSRPDSSNEVIRRTNILALLHPKEIIFAGLNLEEKIGLLKYIPISKITNIQNENDLLNFEKSFGNEVRFNGNIRCRNSDLALGLLLAKYEHKKLIVEDNAKLIDEDIFNIYTEGTHLIMLDDRNGIAPVVAANYAYMLRGKIKMLPELLEEEIEPVYEDIEDKDLMKNSPRGGRSFRSLIAEQLKIESKVDFQKIDAKFITFFTKGYPYGYFFSSWPSTHLFSYPDVGLCVLKGLMNSKLSTNVGLTIDPGFFQDSETHIVNKKLKKLGAFVKCLRGKDAKIYNVGLHLDAFPYDFLFICSHAGKADGEEITLELLDREGKKHELVIEESVGFGLTNIGTGENTLVEVKSHIGFIAIDGKDWQDRTKKIPKNFIEDFLLLERSQWKILKRRSISRVRRAVVIKMSDGNYIPMHHSIAVNGSPLIFNNACTTFNEFSGRFIFAGARAYIGTLTEVSIRYAKEVARDFFTNLDSEKPIPLHLWEIQKKIVRSPKEYIYMHVGVFHTFISPASDSKNLIRERIKKYIDLYRNKNTESSVHREKIERYVNFLENELSKI